MFINVKHKDYTQFWALTKAYLRKSRKLLKETRKTYPAISKLIIKSHQNGEVSVTISLRDE